MTLATIAILTCSHTTVEFDGCDDGERGIPVAKGKKSIERKTHTLTPTTMWQPIQERWGFGATLTPVQKALS